MIFVILYALCYPRFFIISSRWKIYTHTCILEDCRTRYPERLSIPDTDWSKDLFVINSNFFYFVMHVPYVLFYLIFLYFISFNFILFYYRIIFSLFYISILFAFQLPTRSEFRSGGSTTLMPFYRNWIS